MDGSWFVVTLENWFIPGNNGAKFAKLYGQTVDAAGTTRPTS